MVSERPSSYGVGWICGDTRGPQCHGCGDRAATHWDAVSNASKYRVEHRQRGPEDWTVSDASITGTSHTVDGLTSETEHQFRVSVYGSGMTYAAEWSDPSGTVAATTTECVSPVFDDAPRFRGVALRLLGVGERGDRRDSGIEFPPRTLTRRTR